MQRDWYQDLLQQHKQWQRTGYDGHGRRSHAGATADDLRSRAQRRAAEARLRDVARQWQPAKQRRRAVRTGAGGHVD